MNYLEIVLAGYTHHRQFMDRHFLKEFKKAEQEGFQADEFFHGCMGIITGWESALYDASKDADWLYKIQVAANYHRELRGAKAGILFLPGLNSEETVQRLLRQFDEFNTSINDPNKFKIDLFQHNGQVFSLTINQILQIEDAIFEAFQKIKDVNEKSPPEKPEESSTDKVAKPAVKKPLIWKEG